MDYLKLSEDILSIGETDDDIYIRLEYGYIRYMCNMEMFYTEEMITPKSTDNRALCLVTINIPKPDRGKGHCSNILKILEERSEREGVEFLVAPLMDYGQEEVILPKILKNRGYKSIQPVGMRYKKK